MSISIATRGVIAAGAARTIYVAHSIEPTTQNVGIPIVEVSEDVVAYQPDNSDTPTTPIRSIQYIDAPNNNSKFSLPSKP